MPCTETIVRICDEGIGDDNESEQDILCAFGTADDEMKSRNFFCRFIIKLDRFLILVRLFVSWIQLSSTYGQQTQTLAPILEFCSMSDTKKNTHTQRHT